MPTWTRDDICPLMVNAILDVSTTTGNPAHFRELQHVMLNDRLARRFIDEAARQQRRPPEKIVERMVAWFSAEYTEAVNTGERHAFYGYVRRFQRSGTVGDYSYVPTDPED